MRLKPERNAPSARATWWLIVTCFFAASFAAALDYNVQSVKDDAKLNEKNLPTATALRLKQPPDVDGFPQKSAWDAALPLHFDHDWRGENPDPGRATEVRLLWTRETLFLRFQANYRDLNLYPDSREDGWRDKLWDRDVAETFLQPDSSDPLKYKEFEVAPNGFWIDLDVSHGAIQELHSKLHRRVVLNVSARTWTVELAIPMSSLTPAFDPNRPWRANFYRIEGQTEPRFYSAWSPTFTPKPSFHVPAAFGKLVFQDAN